MKVTVQSYDAVPPGRYPAAFQTINEVSYQFGPSWEWEFQVATTEGVTTVTGLTSANFTPNSKAFKWFQGMTGRTPKVHEVIDFDQLKNTRCDVIVTLTDKGYNKIESVEPAATPVAPVAEAAPAPGTVIARKLSDIAEKAPASVPFSDGPDTAATVTAPLLNPFSN